DPRSTAPAAARVLRLQRAAPARLRRRDRAARGPPHDRQQLRGGGGLPSFLRSPLLASLGAALRLAAADADERAAFHRRARSAPPRTAPLLLLAQPVLAPQEPCGGRRRLGDRAAH